MDYYELLGVSRNASEEAIKRAFHNRVRVTHPDVNPNSPSADQETRRLIEAYRTLSDHRARRCYDLFTNPVVSDAPVAVQVRQTPDYATPSPSINKGWLFVILIALVIVLAIHIHNENNRLVFRPFLVNGELPGSVITKRYPLMVEPYVSDYMEWYHTQEYQLSMADQWTTGQMITAYKRAAQHALSQGDTSRARFYNSAIQNVNKLYL